MQIRKSLDKVVAVAGGCLVFATGAGTAAAAVSMAGSGASLLNAWLEGKAKHGPESKRVLERVRKKVRTEFSAAHARSEEAALLDAADYALGEVLLDCIPPPERLAQAFGSSTGFAKAAAEIVLTEVAAKDNLFAETGARAEPLARRFAMVAIEAAIGAALTNQEYFTRLLPFALEVTSRGVGAIQEKQSEQSETLRRIETSNLRVEALLEALSATPIGRRARLEIEDDLPFVILARRINQEVDDPVQALSELTAMVELVLRQQAEAARGTNLGALVDTALRRIAEKSLRGEFNSAAKEAESAFAEWEKREVERQETERLAGLRLVEANIEQNTLRRDADAVARWIERRIDLKKEAEVIGAAGALANASGDCIDRGIAKGLKLESEVAVVLARRALALSAESDDRGAAFTMLGVALQSLGAFESGFRMQEQAIEAYRAALAEYPRDRLPHDWARAQTNLGAGLYLLGSRERGTGRLEEAVMAYRNALEEQTREQVSSDWAATQINLGAALQELADREPGTSRLEEAVSIYRALLKDYTRDGAPFEWSAAQGNLGNALRVLGEREGGTEWLVEAVAATSAVLEETDREQRPLNWAARQQNLGDALRALGQREDGTTRLEQALAAYRAALEEQTPERGPLEWARTALRMASTIAHISERTRDDFGLEVAETLAREAQVVVEQLQHEPETDCADHVLAELCRVRAQLGQMP